jgi:hypothetical protein
MLKELMEHIEAEVKTHGGLLVAVYTTPRPAGGDEAVVLVQRNTDPDSNGHAPFVAWRTHLDEHGRYGTFYWGDYFREREDAISGYNARVREISGRYVK